MDTGRLNEKIALCVATVAVGAMVAYPHVLKGAARPLPGGLIKIDALPFWDAALSSIGWGIGLAGGFWLVCNLAIGALDAMERRRATRGTETRSRI